MARDFTAEEVLEAVEGSGGIMSTVADRLNCTWRTARRYVNMYVSTREAFEAETEQIGDMAESLVFGNIEIAREAQKEESKLVDSADERWLLSRKFKGRGYKTGTELSGEDGPILVEFDMSKWKKKAREQREQVESMDDENEDE